jgi:hypothetical protein
MIENLEKLLRHLDGAFKFRVRPGRQLEWQSGTVTTEACTPWQQCPLFHREDYLPVQARLGAPGRGSQAACV